MKAALDNDQSLSNFAIPFEEDKAFNLKPGETKPNGFHGNNENRQGVQTAPADGNGKR